MNQLDSLNLIRFIGYPNSNNCYEELKEEELINLIPLAAKNKVAIIFLERALGRFGTSKSLNKAYSTYLAKLQSKLDLVTELCRILANSKLRYAIFKTFKPFPSLTVDVDIIFFTHENLMLAYHLLKSKGYNLAGYGAHSITMYSPRHAMNVDLHSEIAVSRMVYINKNLLEEYVIEREMNGCQVPVFEKPISLAMVLTHSLYKEQTLTVADYYTTLVYLLNLTKKQQGMLVNFAEQGYIEYSIKTTLMMVDALTIKVFGRHVSEIDEIAQMIRTNKVEKQSAHLSVRYFEQNIKLPYKYHLSTVATAFLIKIVRDPIMRGTLTSQLGELISRNSNFWESALTHLKGD